MKTFFAVVAAGLVLFCGFAFVLSGGLDSKEEHDRKEKMKMQQVMDDFERENHITDSDEAELRSHILHQKMRLLELTEGPIAAQTYELCQYGSVQPKHQRECARLEKVLKRIDDNNKKHPW